MSFEISQKTLQRLEWGRILEQLAELTATPRGRARCEAGPANGTGLFEADLAGVRLRLAETGEARAILAAGDRPPLAGVAAVEEALARARKEGVLSPHELLEIGATLAALSATRRFLRARWSLAPELAEQAEGLPDHAELSAAIEASFEPSGELRDSASPALAAARRSARGLGGEVKQRIERMLRSDSLRSHLSDAYYTLRNDRYVLPVRADARSAVRGIVHGASGSGTTVFVEPEALVELNNRLKQSEIDVEQETLRVLRALSQRVAAAADSIRDGLADLERIDLAFARARLAEQLGASEPEVGEAGVLRLPQLRHPLLSPSEAVPNDLALGQSFQVLVVSGPNAGGKTVAMKALALAALFVRAGLQVPAAEGSRVDLFRRVLADIGDEQDIRESLSTFSAHMANLAGILAAADAESLVVLDEIGVGTDLGEGASLAQAALESLADAGARVVATTHYNLLKEMAEIDPRFENASVDFDPETLAPTYRLRVGVPGASSATAVAARMGVGRRVLDRAHALLEREDRRLDQMLAELASTRATLESERREAARARQESEGVRADYRDKLLRLQERRDKLFRSMREDLDRAFRDAHAQVAAVIRDLQRGGTARDAAHARDRLEALAERAREAEETLEVPTPAEPAEAPLDWRRAKPGDPVRIRGGGQGVLAALPDRRGRAAGRVGAARVVVPADRVCALAGGTAPRGSESRVALQPATPQAVESPAGHLDLRGLRVDEALDRLSEGLDRALAAGRPRLVIVHGVGSGALQEAVRRQLSGSPYVSRYTAGTAEQGGDGVTLAEL